MNFQKLIEFRYLRDVMVIFAARELKTPVRRALAMKANQKLAFTSKRAKDFFHSYVEARNAIFPDVNLMFPTEDGALYLPEKFCQNVKRLLQQAKQPTTPKTPAKMSCEQIEAIVLLKFERQRSTIQLPLSAGLLGLMALRPGEVANLRKEDVQIENGILELRETKSQEPQLTSIHPDMLTPLRKYVNHLKQGEPLFIRHSGKQWTRIDVLRGLEKICSLWGLPHITPRRLRSTAACQMLRSGIPLPFVSAVLRHKDKATTIRHYYGEDMLQSSRYAMQSYKPIKPAGNNNEEKE